MPSFSARAAWDGESIIDYPVIECAGGLVTSVRPMGQSGSSTIDADFEDGLILPGFINAHCHLEYSFMHRKLQAGQPFIQWLEQVIRFRHETPENEVDQHASQALRMSQEHGTATILDIVTRGNALPMLSQSGMRAWAFWEAIKLDPAQAEKSLADMEDKLNAIETTEGVSAAVSPHAPYSVSEELARSLAQMSKRLKIPLAVHLAETLEEREMLERGQGALFDFLQSLGAVPDSWRAPGIGPVKWAARCGLLGPSTYAIHCNYLDEEDMDLLQRSETTVVYCPGSHAFFSHAPYPLEELLRRGINVCVGTDSLASNDSLDLLRELRRVHHLHPGISASSLFQMIGRNAAKPLGSAGNLGAIAPGMAADFTILRPCPREDDVCDVLMAALEDEAIESAAVVVNESLL